MSEIKELFETIKSRKGADAESSYTAKLFADGRRVIAEKIVEEAAELVADYEEDERDKIVYESVDLIYHMLVAHADAGIEWHEIEAEIARRKGVSGIEEKASR